MRLEIARVVSKTNSIILGGILIIPTVNDYYPKVEYSEAGILHDTKNILHLIPLYFIEDLLSFVRGSFLKISPNIKIAMSSYSPMVLNFSGGAPHTGHFFGIFLSVTYPQT